MLRFRWLPKGSRVALVFLPTMSVTLGWAQELGNFFLEEAMSTSKLHGLAHEVRPHGLGEEEFAFWLGIKILTQKEGAKWPAEEIMDGISFSLDLLAGVTLRLDCTDTFFPPGFLSILFNPRRWTSDTIVGIEDSNYCHCHCHHVSK